MKAIMLFFASEIDPNGLNQLREVINKTLRSTDKTSTILIISEGNRNLLADFPDKYSDRIIMSFGVFKNFNEAILCAKEKGLLNCDLLFLHTPGDDVDISQESINIYFEYFRLTDAGFIISDHFEYIDEIPSAKPKLQNLKPGHDPSNIIIPGRSNNPGLFCHGSLIAVSQKFINSRTFDIDVDYGYDYAVRMGVLAQEGSLYRIPKPLYSFRRGKAYYPGEGLQVKFEARQSQKIGRHFSYT
ncbi:MAG: hypothetical protein JXR87_04900, partial [Candidatus Marinimicrobia bacterium]|nr:hypothetical protein [Candidatus Neomarinimicrobiota bacterium]